MTADPGASGVQLAAFGCCDLQIVAKVAFFVVHRVVLCERRIVQDDHTQLPHDRECHPASSQQFLHQFGSKSDRRHGDDDASQDP